MLCYMVRVMFFTDEFRFFFYDIICWGNGGLFISSVIMWGYIVGVMFI